MRMLRMCTWLMCASLVACTTPPEIKQALVAKDQAYAENVRLMEQYRELVINIDERIAYWHHYLRAHELLDAAIEWATTNPEPSEGAPARKYVDVMKDSLGDKLITLVNDVRFPHLPGRKGSDGTVVFFETAPAAGGEKTKNMEKLIGKLPELVAAIEERVEADYRVIVKQRDLSAFDDYETNVAALRRINAMIKNYLDIDVTVKRTDVKEFADAIRALR
ncbi:MAG: exported protein of unknown function [Nitrospira sp.]|nr:exported protein of unknown function [Nitrospira sp.]